jgi:hypothetical protein
VLSEGIVGDPTTFANIDPRGLSNLRLTLRHIPSTLQERWYSRLYLVMPVTLAILFLFWVLTGLIALLDLDESVRMVGLSEDAGRVAVISGAILDISLGLAVLYRPWSRMACWGMAGVTLSYIVVGSVVRPDLWMDPLGPLLKAVPILMLTLIVALLLEQR